MIVKTLSVGPLQTNCYIVGCGKMKRAAVIDPGDEPERILDAIQASGLKVNASPAASSFLEEHPTSAVSAPASMITNKKFFIYLSPCPNTMKSSPYRR